MLATAVDAFDVPFADDSVIPSYYICKLAKQDVTVALTGLGAATSCSVATNAMSA